MYGQMMRGLGTIAAVTLAAASTGLVSASRAADMSAPAPVYTKAPAAVVMSWTGFYIGGNLGGVDAHASGTSDFLDPAATKIRSTTNPQGNSLSNTRFLGGGQIGYNRQFDPRWVVGVEGDWDWTNAGYNFCRQTDTFSQPCTDNGDGFETIGGSTKWLATARARLGFTVSNFLLYGTGGVAWGRIDTTLSQSCLQNGCGSSATQLFASSTIDHTKAGWVAGLGVEAAIDTHWSVRGEWLHIDLGSITDSLSTVGSGATTQTTLWSRGERFDEFRVGVNYLFK